MTIFVIVLSLISWLFLLFFWGDFWQANQRLDTNIEINNTYPKVGIIVPARNEEQVIAASLTSLLKQNYPGEFAIYLVDDNSSDRTSEIAQATAAKLGKSSILNIISGNPLAKGWKGKLWAVHQGVESAQTFAPKYFLFTDADIQHEEDNLTKLVTKAKKENLDLVSLMVMLQCVSFWEKLLIPAFIFFFQKLYPFSWVNNPHKSMAAAAGGCILISNPALTSIGGISTIKDALIDDCSLAQAVKSEGKSIWIGLDKATISLRGYDHLKSIWDTITRTAYTQLNYSILLLLGTLLGMSIIYLAAPTYLVLGILDSNWLIFGIAALTWLLMTIAFLPTIRLYNLSIFWAFSLPAIAFLYTLMTIDSAVKYYQGQGGAWKGRTYQ